jgi:hypothetical protein
MIFRTPSSPLHSYGEKSGRRHIALLVAVLFHVLVLWLVMHPTRLVLKKPVSSEAGKMVWIQPLTAPPQAVVKLPPSPSLILPSKPKAPPKSLPVPKAELAQQKPVAPPPVPAPVLPTITTPVPTPPPVEDMMAQIEAKQRSRAQARNSQVESQSQEESENQRGVRQAQANIANLQAKAANSGSEQHGGVFRLGALSYHKAEFTFNGWNKNFRRQWPQLVAVELGDERDIETAIIKSMIMLIRRERVAEFTWESHRLGRIVELNARPEFSEELQAFLMREFFPAYRTVARQ